MLLVCKWRGFLNRHMTQGFWKILGTSLRGSKLLLSPKCQNSYYQTDPNIIFKIIVGNIKLKMLTLK